MALPGVELPRVLERGYASLKHHDEVEALQAHVLPGLDEFAVSPPLFAIHNLALRRKRGSVMARSRCEPGAAVAFGTRSTIPTCGRRDGRLDTKRCPT